MPVIDLSYRNTWDVSPFVVQTAFRDQMRAINVVAPESSPPLRQRLRNAWMWLKIKIGWQPAAVGNSVPQRF
uniref:Histidine kinase n=1 Tax=Caenorhabditis tropicalis TaxID=1561998 RepID=A0A1I7T891_9PELO